MCAGTFTGDVPVPCNSKIPHAATNAAITSTSHKTSAYEPSKRGVERPIGDCASTFLVEGYCDVAPR